MILKTTDEILGFLEKGHLSRDFAARVKELCGELVDMGEGSGTVTLKLTFSAKSDMVDIKSKLSSTLPEKKRKSSTAWITPDGEISLQHPDQAPLPLRDENSPSRIRRDAVDIDAR
jgi:hypothetical protein